MLSYETYQLNQQGKTLSIRAWIFCESTTQAKPKSNHYSGDPNTTHRVRFYITDKSRVVLECIIEKLKGEKEVFVTEHETLEDAAIELALMPLESVTPELYAIVMDDLAKRSHSNQDDD